MLRSNRGAARISAVWMISVGVVTLAALAFGFIAQGDLSKAQDDTVAARAVQDAAVADAEASAEGRRNASTLLGWYDRASADPSTDIASASAGIDDLRGTFSDITDSDKDFESIVPKVIASYNARNQTIAQLETRIKSLQADVDAARAASNQVASAKDDVIAQLRTQLSDEQQNAAQRQQEIEDRLTGVQDQLGSRDAELRSVRVASAEKEQDWNKQQQLSQARIGNLQNDLRFRSEEFANYPDGEIIEVSDRLPLAYINIGANQRLTRGMRFRIEGGLTGRTHLKAWGEVVTVNANRAEIALSALEDPFDPVTPGDVIINPLYDPVGGRNAVLAGSFSGTYSRPELLALLANLGINVQEEMDETTHFLIVGSTVYNDPETNEPLEEPIAPKDLAAYKEAEQRQIQIVPLQNIRSFFHLGS